MKQEQANPTSTGERLTGDMAHSRASDGLAHLLRDAQRAVARRLADQLSKHGVTIGQWYFLKALWEEDGLTQRELSARVGMMEPTTVTALNSMEKRDLVQRVRNRNDRRKMNVFLTERGWALKDELIKAEATVNHEVIGELSAEETDQLEAVLKQIIVKLGSGID